MDISNKELIAAGLKLRLQDVLAFGAPVAFASIRDDLIKVAIADFQDHELPAVQIIDVGAVPLAIERPRQKTAWQVAMEIVMRPLVGLEVNQKILWAMEQAVMQSVMSKPQLDVTLPHNGAMVHVLPADRATDLHTYAPTYVSTVGFQVVYYEPLTRRTC